MWYIYELSYNEIPFYVGFSASPHSRYYSHITSPLSRCYNLIRFCIKHFDKYPDINIVDHCQCHVRIRELERNRIKMRLQQGVELVNFINIKIDTITLPKWRIIPSGILARIADQIKEIEQHGKEK